MKFSKIQIKLVIKEWKVTTAYEKMNKNVFIIKEICSGSLGKSTKRYGKNINGNNHIKKQ